MRKYSYNGATYPDQNAVWLDIQNMYPTPTGSYRSCPAFEAYIVTSAPATPGTTRSAAAMQLPSGTILTYVGTSTKLWQFNSGGSFDDRSAAAYTATSWHFAQFGIYSLATNGTDQIQVRDGTGSSNFANLGGSPPATAQILVVQSNAVVAFNLDSGGNMWAASDVGNHANWTTGEAVADTPINARPGEITAAVAFRDEIIVFKKSSIYRMRYVGSPVYWTVDLIADGIGADGKYSVLVCGDLLMFGGRYGNYLFDGSSFRVCDEMNTVASGYLPLVDIKGAAYFPHIKTAVFGLTGNAYCYNLQSDRWGQFSFYKQGGTALTGHILINGTPEALAIISSIRSMKIINLSSTDEYMAGTGTNVTAPATCYIETGYLGSVGEQDLFIDKVTPILVRNATDVAASEYDPSASALTCVVKTATNRRFVSPTTVGTFTAASTGQREFCFTAEGKFFSFRVSSTASFELEDIVIKSRPGGIS